MNGPLKINTIKKNKLVYFSVKMTVDEEEKKNDEEKDLELDLMAEAELLRLTRQFRKSKLIKIFGN